MRNALRGVLALAVFLVTASCMNGASARGRITRLHEIDLHPGPNQINLFVPDGRTALITEGWRDLGNGTGYRIYSVMVPSSNPLRGWDIVPVEPVSGDAKGYEATDIAGSVRFAKGWLDGSPATFLITAKRDPTVPQDASTPTHMVIDTWRLTTARSGGSENAFEPVISTKSKQEFCSPDLAIAREFDLPVPATYTGRNRTDGCPSGV